jgi:hypothetical protein
MCLLDMVCQEEEERRERESAAHLRVGHASQVPEVVRVGAAGHVRRHGKIKYWKRKLFRPTCEGFLHRLNRSYLAENRQI